MIRAGLDSDRSGIFKIWKECFGDDDAYINFFLDKLYRPEYCLICTVGDEPAAMLHLLPLEVIDGGKTASAQYIYAAATLEKYRRQGIMARLLDYSAQIGNEIGHAFTALVPANEGLYDYYGKCGFETAFHLRRVMLDRDELGAIASDKPLTLLKPDVSLMYEQRCSRFNHAVLWGREMFGYIADEWRFTGGEVLSFVGGYSFLRRAGDTLFIKEPCFDKSELGSFAATLLKNYGCEKYLFQLEENSTLFAGGGLMRNGMLRPGINKKQDVIPAGMYFNMMLD